MQICHPLPNFSEEQFREIVERDYQRNYLGTSHTKEELLAALLEWRESGRPIGFYQGVIVIGRSTGDGIFEFHTMNGSSLRTLISAVRQLLSDIALRFKFAVTFYSNPRVESLARHLGRPYRTWEACQGPDRRYATIFDLRTPV